jgi:serine/threonine protein kinase
MAPELCSGNPYSYPADMWALGCVVFELMALHSPWNGGGAGAPRTYPALVACIREGRPDYAPLAREYPTRLVDTAKWMLQRTVAKRATASDIVGLLEMRAPPALAQTICPGAPPPPATPSIPAPPPSVDTSRDDDEDDDACRRTLVMHTTDNGASRDLAQEARCARIVRDAAKLVNAAKVVQQSFRISVERRRIAGIATAAVPRPRTLKPFDRPSGGVVHGVVGTPAPLKKPTLPPPTHRRAPPPPPSPPTLDPLATSARVLQKAVRNSLNRRRRDVVPRARPADPPPPPAVSTRLEQLALPRARMPRYAAPSYAPIPPAAAKMPFAARRVAAARVPSTTPPAAPRPAWV